MNAFWLFHYRDYYEDEPGFVCQPAGCQYMDYLKLQRYYAHNHEIGKQDGERTAESERLCSGDLCCAVWCEGILVCCVVMNLLTCLVHSQILKFRGMTEANQQTSHLTKSSSRTGRFVNYLPTVVITFVLSFSFFLCYLASISSVSFFCFFFLFLLPLPLRMTLILFCLFGAGREW